MFPRLKSKSHFTWKSNEHFEIILKESNPSANIVNL